MSNSNSNNDDNSSISSTKPTAEEYLKRCCDASSRLQKTYPCNEDDDRFYYCYLPTVVFVKPQLDNKQENREQNEKK